jgi:16S rRNA (cytosine967-C5)-methyltransferase
LRVLLSTGPISFETAFERELERRPLSAQDRALARSLAAGALKLRRRLDFMLDLVIEAKHKPLPPVIQQILRLGALQLTELSRVPDFAAVSTSVELAKKWGHSGTAKLVNAVLRRLAAHDENWPWPDFEEDPLGHLATRYSYPNWMVRLWIGEVGVEAALDRCKAGNRRAGVYLRLVRESAWQQAQIDWLTGLQMESKPARWFPEFRYLPDAPDLTELFERHGQDCLVQNEAAAAAVYLADLKPGECLADICAAPGGKVTHAARFVGDRGLLVAIDTHARRLQRLVENLTRVKLGKTLVVRADGRRLPVRNVAKILLDAPCTGLGLLHRHPELRWQKRPEDVIRLAQIQSELLDAGVAALPPGGRLVYSTCSTAREENEFQIERVLKSHPELSPVDPRPLLPAGVPAGPRWVKIEPDPPRLDGAFACALEKNDAA